MSLPGFRMFQLATLEMIEADLMAIKPFCKNCKPFNLFFEYSIRQRMWKVKIYPVLAKFVMRVMYSFDSSSSQSEGS